MVHGKFVRIPLLRVRIGKGDLYLSFGGIRFYLFPVCIINRDPEGIKVLRIP